MSKRAEESALKAYPKCKPDHLGIYSLEYSTVLSGREGFQRGYEQAEKDIISIIESRLGELLGDAQPTPILRYELQDLIKKIKEEE